MKKGFTIVELLIYMGLLTAFTVVTTQVFTSILDVQLSSSATGSVEEDSRYVYNRFAYDVARSSSVVSPASGTSDSLILMIGGIANTYSLSGTNLVLSNISGVNQLNGYNTKVSGLTFARTDSGTGKSAVRITYTVTSVTKSASGSETKTMQTTIAQR